jgi:dienelactone hydrolase
VPAPRLAAATTAAALALGGCGAGAGAGAASHARRPPPPAPLSTRAAATTSTSETATGPAPPQRVGRRVLMLVDHSRRIRLPGGRREPRPLVTEVLYPEHATGPRPLIVFGHGFAVTPAPYRRLLTAWARAGLIVAAPTFPLERAGAPGGPNEADLINQPRDMRFVISALLARDQRRHGFLAGAIAPGEIAVSGQSDGGETALAVAYDRSFIDRRVRAAAILSGAEIPGAGRFAFPAASPPLLATQGTADTVNPPRFTDQFFARARRPKFLLALLGAGHLGPYTDERPQLGVVERVTVAFFERFLEGRRGSEARMRTAGNLAGVAALTADP